LPGRAIRNKFLDDVSAGIRKPFKCPWKCLKTCDFRKAPYCIALALTKAKIGNLDEGFVFIGANAYRVDKIVSVKELIESLLEEHEKATFKEVALLNTALYNDLPHNQNQELSDPL
jgi:NAD(P)H-dependent flavin oxidoreductase YrpB (nitropropane dioxygenase family)